MKRYPTPSREQIDREIDRLFEQTWQAAQGNLQRRARYLANGDGHLAEEWLSCTALKALRMFRRAPTRIRNPQGFLFLVLQHVFVDSVRHCSREQRLFDANAADSIEQAASPMEMLESMARRRLLEQIAKTAAQLPPEQQQLFQHYFIAERSYADIADELGIAQTLVRKRVQLLREKLDRLTSRSRK